MWTLALFHPCPLNSFDTMEALLLLISLSCAQAMSPACEARTTAHTDSTSLAFLMAMDGGQVLTGHWEQRFKEAFDHWSVHDPHVRLDLKDHWAISDSVSVVIVGYATGVSLEEVVFTLRTDGTVIGHAHITSASDWDMYNPEYQHRESKVLDDRRIQTIERHFDDHNDEEPVEVDIRLVTIGMDGHITLE